MAGHSKFANIKHKKERADLKRAKIFTRVGKEIMVAVQQGGPDKSINARLRDTIQKARANNMPNDNIERLIKKAAGETDTSQYEEITYEGYGINGIALVVEALTNNRNRTAANVRSAFTKGGGNMGQTGSVSFMFNQIGQIIIDRELTEDEQLTLMDAGASDFSDDSEIITEPNDLPKVLEALQSLGGNSLEILSAEVIYKPTTYAPPLTEQEDIKKMNRLISLLEEDEDVQNFYHNLEDFE
ncbi:MAG: YebC/PmpR family DNA-binding transcriptional regulator [Defluviitaleaceae bacterium]|nr:YebC/PmpR family DNA-binding transcriptional regulator [Defluviitaleaceae bacterium]